VKDVKNAITHLREHQEFPATKTELVEVCNNLADFSGEDKQWFMKNLPEGTYTSPEDVMRALGWSDASMRTVQ
jgi:hypothetical protein